MAEPGSIVDAILRRTRTEGFTAWLRDTLVALCEIDTTPNADVAAMRDAEAACFDVIERALADCALDGLRTERHAIDPAIADHEHFSLLHFTRTPERPDGLSAEETYAGRSNLLCIAPGTGGGEGVAVNAHVDVVAPFFPPRVEGNLVFGRGACDDKGSCIAMVAALRLLGEVLAEAGRPLQGNIVAMFVVEEETGGNGSLSLAVDRELKALYDSVIVMEGAGNGLYPANRGAVWYRVDLGIEGDRHLFPSEKESQSPTSAFGRRSSQLVAHSSQLFEMSAFVNRAMEEAGRAIRAESRDALFPDRPVQTCHGIIGHVGEHPSRICGEVRFRVSALNDAAEMLARDCIDYGIEEYIGRYGDKTQAVDARTGRPNVDHHLDLRRESDALVVDVHGATGHMGSIFENDGAITKMAFLVRRLVLSKPRLEALAGGPVVIDLDGAHYGDVLTLEGGQGFVPTHGMAEVQRRMAEAARRGADEYLRLIDADARGADCVRVTYDKLHNAAFGGDSDSPAMRHAVAAAKTCGMWRDEPVRGFPVSCDARLFAVEHPGMPVLTSGPGHLRHAHSDAEQLDLDELRTAAEFLAIYLLRQTGTLAD